MNLRMRSVGIVPLTAFSAVSGVDNQHREVRRETMPVFRSAQRRVRVRAGRVCVGREQEMQRVLLGHYALPMRELHAKKEPASAAGSAVSLVVLVSPAEWPGDA